MRASVIVSTFERRDIVLRTVATLLAQDFPATEYEIIVVVDGSTDGTAAALWALPPDSRLRVIEQENRGLAGARNSGIRAAASELLIFLDDDMTCEPALVREHVAAHAQGDSLVGLGAIYVARDNPPNLSSEYFNAGLGGAYLRQRDQPNLPWPEDTWSFANTSIRRDLILQVGLFDERFRMREDAEIGVRLLAVGARRRFLGRAIAYQSCVKNVGDLVRDAEAFAESDALFMRTHPGQSPHGFMERIQSDPRWKRRLRLLLAAHPAMADFVLAPICALGEKFCSVRAFRSIGLRALQLRCGIHWYGRLLKLTEQEATNARPQETS
jgi:glycosyltransferase involved in cell wall biosynthesis